MKYRSLIFSAIALLVAVAMSTATILLEETDWDEWDDAAAGGAGEWTGTEGGGGAVDPQASAGVWSSSTPGVEFSGYNTGNTQIYDDLIYETSDLLVNLSNYDAGSAVFAVTMDFYVDSANYTPDSLSLYFQDANNDWWFYDLGTPSQGNNPYTALIGSDNWYSTTGGGLGAEDFMNALDDGAILAAGINVIYEQDVSEHQEYGITSFAYQDEEGFTVPEPGTYMVLSVAFMSMGFSFRRRQREEKS